ncbi:MAG: site-2 protease family protein [Candidatus Moraniibacteriota bacterium]
MINELVLVGFYFLTLIYSVVIHEVSHGWMAWWLGDLTAKYAGRLDLNPMKHIDPFGSIIVPIAMFLTTGFAFGWAKPVPYNPYNLRDQKWGPALVAIAGPLSNLTLALLAVTVSRLLPLSLAAKGEVFSKFLGVLSGAGGFSDRWGLFASSLSGSFPKIFFGLMLFVIFWNVLLAFFNLIPIPPLDGSKLLYATFSLKQETVMFLERYGFFILLFVVFFLSTPVSIVLNTGLNFFFGLMF